MNFRRTGELAFAIVVIALGGGLLSMAAGRFMEPLALAPQTIVAPDVRPSAVAIARVSVPKRGTRARHARSRPSHASVAFVPTAAAVLAVAPVPTFAPIAKRSVVPVVVANVSKPKAATIANATFHARPNVSVKAVRVRVDQISAHEPLVEVEVKPDSAPLSLARVAFSERHLGGAVAAHSLTTLSLPFGSMPKAKTKKRAHRFGIALVHVVPNVERTPEPPIGYELHPALLRADLSIPANSNGP